MQTTASAVLGEKEAATYINLTPRFLQARRVRGGGPRFIRFSRTRIGYRVADLDKWLESLVVGSTSDQTPAERAGAGA